MAMPAGEIEIVPYREEWRADFERLNREWLERYFSVEDFDQRMFADPETMVIAPGGAIYFARVREAMVGTIAVLCESQGVHELSKMAVTPAWQGRGIGRLLVEAAIAFHRRRRGTLLFLETNSAMLPAMGLYAATGFVRQPALRSGSHYGRSNVCLIHQSYAGSRDPDTQAATIR